MASSSPDRASSADQNSLNGSTDNEPIDNKSDNSLDSDHDDPEHDILKHDGLKHDQSAEMDRIIQGWPYAPEEVAARHVQGADGRELLQLRIDLGILQLEVENRPDGFCPEGHATYYDLLVAQAIALGERFIMHEYHCKEIDREFVQFYHRRVAWLALRSFDRAIADADHTLALMDFSSANAPCDEWVELHEQYRPFVLFHRTQAETLGCLAASDPERGLLVLTEGISHMCHVLDQLSSYHSIDDDLVASLERAELEESQESFVTKLEELKSSIIVEYDLTSPLVDQLAAAIEGERYELAAELRDRITSGRSVS